MKKFKILFATVMLGIATVGGFQAYEYANMTTAETLLLNSVEALASNETHDGYYESTGFICNDCGGDMSGCIHCSMDDDCSCTPTDHTC